jgi:hypothetical protein
LRGEPKAAALVSAGVGGEDRVVDDVKIRSEQHLVRFVVQTVQEKLLFGESGLLNEFGKQVLYLIEIAHVKEVHLFRRFFQNPGDRLIIEQQVDPIHTLGEKVFNLVEMGFADLQLFHNLMVCLNPRLRKPIFSPI